MLRRTIIAALLTCTAAAPAAAQDRAAPPVPREATVTHRVTGTFDVKLTPQPVHAGAEGVILRMSLDKRYHGPMEGSSQGEMLATGPVEDGSGGYVAIERFTGTLGGRTGSFALQHSGTMDGGAQQLTVIVVPGTGTDELRGIAGALQILIEQGRHSYVLDYTFPGGDTP